jgi:hypothetical protein
MFMDRPQQALVNAWATLEIAGRLESTPLVGASVHNVALCALSTSDVSLLRDLFRNYTEFFAEGDHYDLGRAKLFIDRSRYYQLVGDLGEAEHDLEVAGQLLGPDTDTDLFAGIIAAHAAWCASRARLSGLLGDSDAEVAAWPKCIAFLLRLSDMPQLTRAYIMKRLADAHQCCAQAMERTGDQKEADRHLRQFREIYESLRRA